MKLTCEAVEDFYVLYQEDELHLSVKQAVEQHLEHCVHCREVYSTRENFFKSDDAKKADETIAPSSKLDQQIKMKLKLRKMKIAFLFLITLTMLFSFFQYVDDRKSLLYEVSSLEQTVRDLYFQLDRVKIDQEARFTASSLVSELNEKTARFDRHLNMYEKRELANHPYQMNINFNYATLLNYLNDRYRHGQWTDKDEAVLQEMKNYFESYTKLLTDERLKLNEIYDYHPTALIKPFEGVKIKEIHQSIDQLAYTYAHFQQFPDEITIMGQEEIKARARVVFHEPEAEVTLTPVQNPAIVKGYGTYTTSISGENGRYYASWEAYTGRLLDFNNHQRTKDGQLLPEEEVKEKVAEYIPTLIGAEEFRLESLGINYNYSSNVDHKLYTFKVIPSHEGIDTNASYRFHVDGRTGIPSGLISTDEGYYSHLSFSPSDIAMSKHVAENQLEKDYPTSSFNFKETSYIPSLLSNRYEVVHIFEGKTMDNRSVTKLVNARTGKEEVAY